MIARAYRYRRSLPEFRRLNTHLWKPEGQRPELVGTRNLCVHHTVEGMGVMAALTAASRAQIAFWHIWVAPQTKLTRTEATKVVDLIIAELKAQDHPVMVWAHNDKPRARRGGGPTHLHVVLGHVSLGLESPKTPRALDMRHHAPRLHKVMAIAAYQIEGKPVASPWHKSIVQRLRAENNGHVADWLIDTLGDAPVFKPPRLTDSMRRSADAAGFPLPSFQAELERLWNMGATEAEIALFLSENNVSIEPGSSTGAIALHHEKLFVGLLHRIVKQDPSSVYEQAQRRLSDLFGFHGTSPDEGSLSASGLLKRRNLSARDRLGLQTRIDIIEKRLAGLRLERLRLIYASREPAASAPANAVWASGSAEQAVPCVLGEEDAQGDVADRVSRLARAEAVLDVAASLLWQDPSWTARSHMELMQAAAKIANSAAENPALDGVDLQLTGDGEGDVPDPSGWRRP